MTNIETLKTEVDQVKIDLDACKAETSEEIKKSKAEAAVLRTEVIEKKVKAAKEEIIAKITALEAKTDATSKAEVIAYKADLATIEERLTSIDASKTELATLQATVTTPEPAITETTDKKDETKTDDTDKSWIRKQRDGVTSKEEWKTNTWANVARIAWGIGIVALGVRGIKKLFGIGKDKEKKDNSWDEKNTEETKEKKWNSWRKWLLGGWILAAGWYGLYNLLKWKWLSFEDSLIAAEADLGTISESDEINIDRWKISYEESVKQIKSYGLGTKIDKWGLFSAKKIEGLDIKFSDYKQLIHAANLVNYIKHKYTWRCETDTPFYTKSSTWDIYIKIKDWENNTKEEEIISGGIRSTLSSICPDVLNGIFTDTKNKDKFLAYLNKQGVWKEWNVVAPDAKWDKIQEKMNEVWQEIVDTPTEFDPLWKERGQIIATANTTDKTEYTIKSRWTPQQETEVKMEANTDGTITSWKIDGLSITFTTVEELLRTANLINKLKYQYHVVTPLLLGPNEEAFYRTSSFWIVWWHPWIYVDNSTTWTLDDRVIKKETLENIFPTILKNKEIFIKYLNGLKDENGKGLREK